MRYPASEKIEIIRLVEQSHLPIRQTLDKIGIPRAIFYRWYDLYQTDGPEALEDRSPRPRRVWNRISDAIRAEIARDPLSEAEKGGGRRASSCSLRSSSQSCRPANWRCASRIRKSTLYRRLRCIACSRRMT